MPTDGYPKIINISVNPNRIIIRRKTYTLELGKILVIFWLYLRVFSYLKFRGNCHNSK